MLNHNTNCRSNKQYTKSQHMCVVSYLFFFPVLCLCFLRSFWSRCIFQVYEVEVRVSPCLDRWGCYTDNYYYYVINSGSRCPVLDLSSHMKLKRTFSSYIWRDKLAFFSIQSNFIYTVLPIQGKSSHLSPKTRGCFFAQTQTQTWGRGRSEARAVVRHTFDVLHVYKHFNRRGNCWIPIAVTLSLCNWP